MSLLITIVQFNTKFKWILNNYRKQQTAYLNITLNLFIYIENVNYKFERDISFIQLESIKENMFKKIKDKKMDLYANKPDDIKLMKVI